MKKYYVDLCQVPTRVSGQIIIEAESLEQAEQKYNDGDIAYEIDNIEIQEFPERIGCGGEPAPTLDEFYQLANDDEEGEG